MADKKSTAPEEVTTPKETKPPKEKKEKAIKYPPENGPDDE